MGKSYLEYIKEFIAYEVIVIVGVSCMFCCIFMMKYRPSVENSQDTTPVSQDTEYIKYVDFNVTYDVLSKAYELDVSTYGSDLHLDWIELIAYAACRGGGEFGSSASEYIDDCVTQLEDGKTMSDITVDMKYYSYYYKVYYAVLAEYVGEYKIELEDGSWEEKYGLKAFSPIAKGFDYSDYDDFGVSRSYGYQRQHLGHDMMGLVGTPIIAVESGYVEVMGWNMYGGWRVGIRSNDNKRYYYYAHLRQNVPFAAGLKEGDQVTAGDVIGYMGHTGYSTTENVNNIEEVHLHYGLQLIFDESQKESDNEIWIDCYALCRLLSSNRSEVVREDNTKEWVRRFQLQEKSPVGQTTSPPSVATKSPSSFSGSQ